MKDGAASEDVVENDSAPFGSAGDPDAAAPDPSEPAPEADASVVDSGAAAEEDTSSPEPAAPDTGTKGPGTSPADSGSSSTSSKDSGTAVVDSGTKDTGTVKDTGTYSSKDSGTKDTSVADSSIPAVDSSMPDTSKPDTTAVDTSVADSSSAATDSSSSALVWRQANLTTFTSYPDPGSEECIKYSGCLYAGQFAALSSKQTEAWVQSHNIAAVHSKDFAAYKLHTLRLKQGTKQIDVVVYDECADSDCSGCCTANSKSTGFLIDIEKYTMERFGTDSGIIDWACIDC